MAGEQGRARAELRLTDLAQLRNHPVKAALRRGSGSMLEIATGANDCWSEQAIVAPSFLRRKRWSARWTDVPTAVRVGFRSSKRHPALANQAWRRLKLFTVPGPVGWFPDVRLFLC